MPVAAGVLKTNSVQNMETTAVAQVRRTTRPNFVALLRVKSGCFAEESCTTNFRLLDVTIRVEQLRRLSWICDAIHVLCNFE